MGQKGRTLLHVVNLSGHSQTGYFPPIPMADISVEIAGSFHSGKTMRNPVALKLETAAGTTKFQLPKLVDYELIVLE
ncbi:MAG: hypothetical protein JST93_20380 [Acidobacteria bacterium]|nr:hypothetical protein [Acidobacteriota bacterium]